MIEEYGYHLTFREDGGELASGKLKIHMWTLKATCLYITFMTAKAIELSCFPLFNKAYLDVSTKVFKIQTSLKLSS